MRFIDFKKIRPEFFAHKCVFFSTLKDADSYESIMILSISEKLEGKHNKFIRISVFQRRK